MYGCEPKGKSDLVLDDQLFGTVSVQWDSLAYIKKMVQQMGKPPSDLSCRGALQLLQAASGYTGDQPVGALASFNLEAVSFPSPGWRPIDLADIWGSDGQRKVNEFVSNELLPPEIAKTRLDAVGLKRPYCDPLLRQGKTYHEFLRRLSDSNLIDYSLQPAKERISFFCVSKKAGKLRLICDARRANAHFADPSYVQLTTGEGLGSLEIEEGQRVLVGTADLKDAFYHLSLPLGLRDYFCLQDVAAGDVGVTHVGGRPVGRKHRITPRLAVIPMGWSWGLYICQQVHESIAGAAGLTEQQRVRDKRRPPNMGCCHTQYVDNLIVAGTNHQQVKELYDKATEALKSAGLQVHEEEVTFGARILGWEITAEGIFSPARSRAWKVRLALRGLLQKGRCAAHLLEKVIGHCSFLCLGRRECFSIFGDVYTFIRRRYKHSLEFPLPKSVQRELEMFDAIIPLIQRNLASKWRTTVHAVDASEWGLGATSAEFNYEEVKSYGHYNERWRFKDPQQRNPRQQVLSQQDDQLVVPTAGCDDDDDDDVEPTMNGDHEGFQQVPFNAVDRTWKTVGRYKGRKRASLPVTRLGLLCLLSNMCYVQRETWERSTLFSLIA